MAQRLFTKVEQDAVGPHISHPDPHPQYRNPVLSVTQVTQQISVAAGNTVAAATIGAVGAAGSSSQYSRGDHVHAMPGMSTPTESGFTKFVAPIDGGVLDIENGTIVWDVTNQEQVAE